jgi:hypothetical protein
MAGVVVAGQLDHNWHAAPIAGAIVDINLETYLITAE